MISQRHPRSWPLIVAALLLVVLFVAEFASSTRAEDWPQWRGPERTGVSRETGLLDRWPVDKMPPVAWRASVGRGHSSVSVSGGRAFTMGWDGERDTVYCFDAASGEQLWSKSYPCDTILQWPGPRATPTVVWNRVYTLGQHGQLHAWDARDGKSVWSVQLAESYNPDVDYGFAWSPLVMGDHLILSCGRGGLAIRTSDGGYAWGNDGQHGACASPVPFTFKGRQGVAVVVTDQGRNGVSLIGVDPRDGKRLWREGPWPEKWGAACVDPVIVDGKLFMTTAEQHLECARFTMNDGKLTLDWSNNELPCYTGGCVQLGDCLYGVNKHGILKCLDWETGKLLWAERGFGGHGSLIAADGALVVQSSKGGDVVVVAAQRNGYQELRHIQPFEGEADTFTAPVLANGRLYARSYAGEVVCLDLTK